MENDMEVEMEDQGHEADAMAAEPMQNMHEEAETNESAPSNESLSVQKRLKAQKRAHERETRELHSRISELESRMQPQQSQQAHMSEAPQGGELEGLLQKAVHYGMTQREESERKQREDASKAHVAHQYQVLHQHLESMNDKYDDFHESVMGNQTPFTTAMHEYSLTLPKKGAGSAGEVLYKLAKNPDELSRISRLHPLDQASEMAKLSHALISGGNSGDKSSSGRPPLSGIKSNPVTNSAAINEKTSVGELRARMKAGWK